MWKNGDNIAAKYCKQYFLCATGGGPMYGGVPGGPRRPAPYPNPMYMHNKRMQNPQQNPHMQMQNAMLSQQQQTGGGQMGPGPAGMRPNFNGGSGMCYPSMAGPGKHQVLNVSYF